MRCNRGTENTIIGTLQQFFRWYDDDYFAGSGSFMEGKSTENQRIEAWWSKFREGGGGWWINLLKDLHDCGLYHDDYLVTECLRLIDTGNRGWKADVIFLHPDIYGTHNYLTNLGVEDVTLCKEMYAESCTSNIARV